MGKRIGILVVAYNAASTLADVLDRIPAAFLPRIERILVGDDHSSDATYLVGLGYQQSVGKDLPLEVIRHPRNLGYGGNQKAGYRWAIDHDLDVVVLLHGDGQYAPELLPEMVEPLERDEADVVLGSRMMEPGAARRGGMPAYKYLGNRILTTFENAVAGAQLTEWHSGYRAYSVDALRAIPFGRNDDGFNFDTQIILQCLESGQRIREVPIPTYYGDEICYVNGLGYAREVASDVLRYRAHKMGFGTGETAFATSAYELKCAADSSHQQLLAWMGRRPPGTVLDLGCADGLLDLPLREAGHRVVGVDLVESPGVRERVDEFHAADLDHGLPEALDGPFDTVLCADVFEHVRRPGELLDEIREVLSPDGAILASVPNFAHWYPRARVALGRFDYDQRGILDEDHVRFFTRRSFERLVRAHGFEPLRRGATGLPVEIVNRGAAHDPGGAGAGPRAPGALRRVVAGADHLALSLAPGLFSYQLVYELRRG